MINFPDNPTVNQVFISGAQSWTWDGAKWVASGVYVGPPQYSNDNRIINGDMMIDQRGVASAGGGTASGYTVDRWRFYVTANVLNKVQFSRLSASQGGDQQANGIGYALMGLTATAYAVVAADNVGFMQIIEADLLTDIAWGLPNAQSLTLSFMVNAGQAGTYGGAIRNAANTRSYPFTYSVPNAGQWTKIAITIPGDTAGTWTLRGNAAGLNICFDLGSGSTWLGPANAWSNGNYLGAIGQQGIVANLNNQWMFSSVKLELGSVATPFNRKTVQESLADCQRYCYRVGSTIIQSLGAGYCASATLAGIIVSFPVTMRTNPTVSVSSVAGFTVNGAASSAAAAASNSVGGMQVNLTSSGLVVSSGATANVTANNWIGFDAEL